MATVLGYANQIDLSTLSGGSWNASYPLSRLKNRYLQQKARTTNALATSSVIDIDLGAAVLTGVVALIAHNLSAAATVRIQASSSASQSPSLYDGAATLIYTGTDYGVSFPPVAARYWRISIADTSNPAGYIELGRVFLGSQWKPTNNIDWGCSLQAESQTAVSEALAGPEFFDSRPVRRVMRGKWSWLSDTEAMTFLDLLRSHDISGEVYLIFDDASTSFRAQRNYLARIRQLPAIESPYLAVNQAAFELSELL